MFQFRLSKLFVAVTIAGLVFAWIRLVMSEAFLAAFVSLWACGLPGAILVGVWRDAGRLDKATIVTLFFIGWTFLTCWTMAVAFGVYASSTAGFGLVGLLLLPLALFLPVMAALLVVLARLWKIAWRDRLAARARAKIEQDASNAMKQPDRPPMKE